MCARRVPDPPTFFFSANFFCSRFFYSPGEFFSSFRVLEIFLSRFRLPLVWISSRQSRSPFRALWLFAFFRGSFTRAALESHAGFCNDSDLKHNLGLPNPPLYPPPSMGYDKQPIPSTWHAGCCSSPDAVTRVRSFFSNFYESAVPLAVRQISTAVSFQNRHGLSDFSVKSRSKL